MSFTMAPFAWQFESTMICATLYSACMDQPRERPIPFFRVIEFFMISFPFVGTTLLEVDPTKNAGVSLWPTLLGALFVMIAAIIYGKLSQNFSIFRSKVFRGGLAGILCLGNFGILQYALGRL